MSRQDLSQVSEMGYQVAIGNALPASLLVGAGVPCMLVPMSPGQVRDMLEGAESWISAVGHEDLAPVLSSLIGMDIPFNRVSLPADWIQDRRGRRGHGLSRRLITALYTGPRLPEGATRLPEGAQVGLYLVSPLWITGATWVDADGEIDVWY